MENNQLISFDARRHILTGVLFVCSSLFMNNFFKCTIALLADGFDGGMHILTMVISYILPVICFLVYFYNYYIKRLNKVGNIVYSSLVIVVSLFTLINIFSNLEMYVSNNALGVYEALPSVLLSFPYDGIVVNIILIAVQVFNLILVFKPDFPLYFIKEHTYQSKPLNISVGEYIVLSFLASYALFGVGDFLCGLNSIENALYDLKYIYLLILMLLPALHLITSIFKFENLIESEKGKTVYYSSLIGINATAIILFILFELIYPDFVVGVGKPLFPITYTISMPFELIVLFFILICAVVLNVVKLLTHLKKTNN